MPSTPRSRRIVFPRCTIFVALGSRAANFASAFTAPSARSTYLGQVPSAPRPTLILLCRALLSFPRRAAAKISTSKAQLSLACVACPLCYGRSPCPLAAVRSASRASIGIVHTCSASTGASRPHAAASFRPKLCSPTLQFWATRNITSTLRPTCPA